VRDNDFPRDDGASAQAIRAFDWSKTALGPIETWPISLKTIVDAMLSSKFPQAVVWGPDYTTLHNDAFRPILAGKASAIGRSFADVWSEAWSTLGPIAEQAYAGTPTFIADYPLTIERNGQTDVAYFTFCYSPLRDDAGRVSGMLDTVVETTETVRTQQAQAVLARELMHRVKNTMAVTSAIVTASMRHATTLDEARDTITARIEALSRTQALLNRPSGSADVDTVVREAIAPLLDDPARLSATGPTTSISAQQAVGLSLAIYELATNALKYGALSVPEGRVSITWSTGENNAFDWHWRESGGPVVSAPKRAGFGSRLTNRIVASYFAGKGETLYAPEGVEFRLHGKIRVETDDRQG
jgi:two-component sensor histidine kinase